MNFFAEQDQARRSTKHLVLLFIAAVLSLIIITNLFVAVTFWIVDGQLQDYSEAGTLISNASAGQLAQYFSWQKFGKITLFVCGAIFCVIAFKWLQLSAGGKRVAESLGGRRINPNTGDASEKRILNVVEEMALAAGMPVPSVYLLEGEKGINAFAAGNTPADAVIGITKGAIEQFDREQLQGVVAHEFSHILNGDMRLNLRMVAMLSGIIFIGSIGRFIMYSGGRHGAYRSTRRSGDARVFMLGLGLVIIGWMGTFFGGLIKAAISRQREFLADASAVQFTRNPQGIASALKVIGGYNAGSQVFSSGATEASHMFIAEALGNLVRFDTHPPLEQRIKKIQPDWDGQMIARKMRVDPPKEQHSAHQGKAERKRQATIAAAAAAAFVTERKQNISNGPTGNQSKQASSNIVAAQLIIQQLPPVLTRLAQEPFGASALVYGLLLDKEQTIRNKQLSYIEASGTKGLAFQCQHLHADIAALDKTLRLPLLELAIPALKLMSAQQYKIFKKTLLLIIRADKKFEMFEWCLFQLCRHYLAPEFEANTGSKALYKTLKPISEDYAVVLSCLAHYGQQESSIETIERSFGRAANTVGLYQLKLLPVEQCQLDDFGKAVNKLACCYPLLKPKVLKSFADCVKQDQLISHEEREIIAAIAAVMDCPQPLLEL